MNQHNGGTEHHGEVVAITGVAGYLGQVLVEQLERDDRVAKIVGIDRSPSQVPSEKLSFHQRCITQPGLDELFRSAGVTRVAHLAFRLAPNHQPRQTHEVNVGGTRNVLAAAAAVGVKHVAFASSSVVYGAHPNNPSPIPETHRLHGARQVQYTLDKIDVEEMCRQFRHEHPTIDISILRLVTIMGARANNFITRFFARPFLVLPSGFDPSWQFVHELDCGRAVQAALMSDKSGTYNVGADGSIKLSEVGRQLGKPIVRLPRGVLKSLTNLLWYTRQKWLTEIPGALVDYMCWPPVLCNQRIKDELGFRFEFTSAEAVAAHLEEVEDPESLPAETTRAVTPPTSADQPTKSLQQLSP